MERSPVGVGTIKDALDKGQQNIIFLPSVTFQESETALQVRVIERAQRDMLGEGPLWDEARQALLWVDIVGRQVHAVDIDSGRHTALPVPEPIGWVLPRAAADDFVAGFRSGFAFLDIDSGAIRPIGNPEPERPQNRLNDAKVDAAGRIWAGSKDDQDEQASGALYRLDADLRWKRLDDGYGVANGPTFCPENKTLYHTDSAARTIYAMDLAPDGSLSGKRVWLRFEDAWGYPDGMTTDAEGCIWIAHWGGGRISRFSPGGKLLRSIALPATNITSCTFAGPALDRMFVTSSRIDAAEEPLAGCLFEIDPGVQGLPQPRFAG